MLFDAMANNEMGKNEHRHLALLAAFGMGLFWTWTLLTGYSLSMFFGSDNVVDAAHDIWIKSSWAQALAFAVIAVIARKVKTFVHRRVLVIITPILVATSAALCSLAISLFGNETFGSRVTVDLGAALMGVSGAVLILMWAELLSRFDANTSSFAMNMSLVVSSVLYFVSALLPSQAIFGCNVVFPCLSGLALVACLALYRRDSESVPFERDAGEGEGACASVSQDGMHSSRRAKILVPLATVFFCAFCGEVYRTLIVLTQHDVGFARMGDIYAIGGGVGAAVLACIFAVFQARGKRNSESAVVRVVLVVMVVGYVVSVVYDRSFYAGYAFFCVVFGSIRCLSWMFTARVVSSGRVRPLRAFAVSLILFSLPVALSATFMDVLASSITSGLIPWTTVATVTIAALFGLAVLILDPRDVASVWGLVPREEANTPSPRESLVAMAENTDGVRAEHGSSPSLGFLRESFGLTNREMDVARLLYQGRSIPFIQEELCIAEGTATTHLRHIYRKLDVHTRQEFISVIQAEEEALGR